MTTKKGSQFYGITERGPQNVCCLGPQKTGPGDCHTEHNTASIHSLSQVQFYTGKLNSMGMKVGLIRTAKCKLNRHYQRQVAWLHLTATHFLLTKSPNHGLQFDTLQTDITNTHGKLAWNCYQA